jgi:polysaccharide export outer membrane protein
MIESQAFRWLTIVATYCLIVGSWIAAWNSRGEVHVIPVGSQTDVREASQPQPVTPAPQAAAPRLLPRMSAASLMLPGITSTASHDILLCQTLAPSTSLGASAPAPQGAAMAGGPGNGMGRRSCSEDARLLEWGAFAQGEYVARPRLPHVAEYRIRVDDQLQMLFRLTREETAAPYRLNVGDEIKIESFTDPELNRSLLIQPDGTITLRLLGQVHATGRTIVQLRDALEEQYTKYYKVPSITVTPLKVNTQLDDLRNTVDRRAGIGGQLVDVRVTPEGSIALPAIGNVHAQGLSLSELQTEINERYHERIEGIEVMPVLTQRAPRYIYVLGEVKTPGRFEMVGPTTILQAIALAGSWNVGANMSQVVVFRRGDDWQLMASMVNLTGALRGKQLCAPGEIWLADSDVVIVPKGRILEMDDFINLVFTRGLYGIMPVQTTVTFQKLSSL